MQDINEPNFIKQIQAGDEDAFRRLLEVYGKTVYNTCLNFLQSAPDAEDITQEVFLSVHLSIQNFKNDSKLTTWIYRIAVTKSLDAIRMKNRKKRFGLMRAMFKDLNNEPIFDKPNFDHPGILLENKERASILFKAIDKLPENQRAAFLLNKIEQLSYNEVATILQISISAVESLLFRAKQNLHKILANYYEQNEK
jgi:RNA polymerase sigma-70 factor (ECF subfamily)